MVRMLGAAVLALLITACGDSGEKENNATVIPAGDTAKPQTPVEYMPVIVNGYAGVVPCDDCDGVETSLSLYADTTYQLKTAFIGKNPKDTAGLNQSKSGSFMMHNDTVHLEGVDIRYLKTDTALIQLDKSGKYMTGKKAVKYVLKKVK